jgi:hypothetical protein
MLCGANCADRPRIKDPKGRYSCRDCYEQAIARRTQRRAAARVEASPQVIDEVLEASGSHVGFSMKPCTSCGMPVPEDAVICMRCGFDGRNGRAHHVRVEHGVRTHAEPRFRLPGLFSPPSVAVMVIAFFGVLLLASFGEPRLLLGYLVLDIVFGVGLAIAILIGTFRESIAHGLGLIFVPVAAGMVAAPIAGPWGDAFASGLSLLYVVYVVFWICDSQYVRWLFVANFIVGLGLLTLGAVLAGAAAAGG